jgi:hypothetical protein
MQEENLMVPKAVSDAGYTAIGLGVLAVEEVQTRRRETRARLEAVRSRLGTEARRAMERAGSVAGQVKAKAEPVVSAQLKRLPGLVEPVKKVVDEGRGRLQGALKRSRS